MTVDHSHGYGVAFVIRQVSPPWLKAIHAAAVELLRFFCRAGMTLAVICFLGFFLPKVLREVRKEEMEL